MTKEYSSEDLDQRLADLKRRREALRGRGRQRPGRETRDQRIETHREQIRTIVEEVLPAMRKGSYGWRVANNDLENRRAELRVLLGVEKPGDRYGRGKIEQQAMRGAVVEAVTK